MGSQQRMQQLLIILPPVAPSCALPTLRSTTLLLRSLMMSAYHGHCLFSFLHAASARFSMIDVTAQIQLFYAMACRFAQRMRCIANEFIVNVRKEPTAIIRKYEQDIAELQQELAMHDSLTERHQITYGQYTDAQKTEVAAQVQAFLQSQEAPDSIVPLQLVSLRHMKEVLYAAKVTLVCSSYSLILLSEAAFT